MNDVDGTTMDFHWLLSVFIQQGYLLVFFAVFLDNAGVPLPGELALLAFGFLARTGHLHVGGGLAAASLGAMAGDNVSYWVGRLGGVRILQTYCRITLGSGQCVEKAVAFYHRFGRLTVILGRFVLGLRAFVVPLAGSTRIPYGQFLLFDAIGALLWSTIFIVTGYALGNQAELVSQWFRGGEGALGLVAAITFIAYLAVKRWKRRRYGTALIERSRA